MIVCHCSGVTDRDIKQLVREGCKTVDDIAERCWATMGCGGCRESVERILSEELKEAGR